MTRFSTKLKPTSFHTSLKLIPKWHRIGFRLLHHDTRLWRKWWDIQRMPQKRYPKWNKLHTIAGFPPPHHWWWKCVSIFWARRFRRFFIFPKVSISCLFLTRVYFSCRFRVYYCKIWGVRVYFVSILPFPCLFWKNRRACLFLSCLFVFWCSKTHSFARQK